MSRLSPQQPALPFFPNTQTSVVVIWLSVAGRFPETVSQFNSRHARTTVASLYQTVNLISQENFKNLPATFSCRFAGRETRLSVRPNASLSSNLSHGKLELFRTLKCFGERQTEHSVGSWSDQGRVVSRLITRRSRPWSSRWVSCVPLEFGEVA